MQDHAASSDAPIGIFDSGVGGLTVASAIGRLLPGESILYLGDTARLPYGTKSARTVRRYCESNIGFFLRRGVKGVVIACNSASAMVLPGLEAAVPIWGVIVPGAAAAAAVARERVGVIATESTVRSKAYPEAIRALRPELEVWSQACGLFPPIVEEGWTDDPITRLVAERYLAPLLERGIDTLVLGCTHFPLLRKLLGEVVGPDVQLVDPGEAVATLVAEELAEMDLLRKDGAEPEHHLCVSDASPLFQRFGRSILGDDTDLELVEL